jgi:hypothetical protein
MHSSKGYHTCRVEAIYRIIRQADRTFAEPGKEPVISGHFKTKLRRDPTSRT